MKTIKILLVAVIAGVSSSYFTQEYLLNQNVERSRNLSNEQRDDNSTVSWASNTNSIEQINFTDAAERAVDGVVHVKMVQKGEEIIQFNPFQFFYGGQSFEKGRMPDKMGSGSGVILTEDGYIVTNNHVVDGADEIEVVIGDKRHYKAEVIGTDPATDLALLKVTTEEKLPYLKLANSENVKLGEWVMAVGNPYNLTSSVTAGIVSAKGRNINIIPNGNGQYAPVESFIQTDAAVNPGNSGGALVDLEGNVIGINTAIQSPTGSFSGYAFAIPSNIVSKVVADLAEFGVVQRAFLGVSVRQVDDALKLKEELSSINGLYVATAIDGGAAEVGGLEAGDLIQKIEGKSVNSMGDLQEVLSSYKPGDEVSISVNRDGNTLMKNVVLQNQFGGTTLIEKGDLEKADLLGATIVPAENKILHKYGLEYGFQVQDLNEGKLKAAGVKEGFIITAIDQQPVTSLATVRGSLSKIGKEGRLIVGFYPNGQRAYYAIGK